MDAHRTSLARGVRSVPVQLATLASYQIPEISC